MKKVTKISSLLLLSLAVLTGCANNNSSTVPGGNTGNTGNTGGGQNNSQYNWTITVSTPVEQTNFVRQQCQNFLKDNGYTNVKINIVNYAEGEVDSKVTDWTATGAPDIYAFASDKTLSLVQNGALARVPSQYVNQMKADMTEGAIESGSLGDNMYAYPYAGDNGYFLYINTKYVSVDKADSVEDIIAACAAAKLKFAYPLGEAFYSMAMLTTFGASYTVTMNDDYTDISTITATYDSEEGLLAAKGFKDLVTNPNVMVGDSKILAAPTQANGIGAIVGGSWNSADFETQVKAEGGTLIAMKMPTITVDGKTETLRSFLGYKLYGVNPLVSGDDTARLAFDHSLANYLVSETVQNNRFDTFKTAPTNKKVAASEKVTSNQYVKAINDQAQYAIPQTIVPQGLWNAPASLYSGVQSKEISTDAELREAMDALNTAVETAE